MLQVIDLRKLDVRRKRLGMSRAMLARRANVSIPTVHRIMTGKELAPSVATIESIAAALGMELQLVAIVDTEDLREQQAKLRATQLVSMVQGTMGLESQAVDQKAVDNLKRRHTAQFLAGPGRRLWAQ